MTGSDPTPGGGSAAHNLPPIRLLALSVVDAAALLGGTGRPAAGLDWHEEYPMAETLEALGMTRTAHRAMGWTGAEVPTWWLHQIVLGGAVVGDIGFHGPPAPDEAVEVEIGYNVVPALRGQGIATRACRLILQRAWADGAVLVRAETAPDNVASQRVLFGAGFQPEGDFRYLIGAPERTSAHAGAQ